MCTYPKNLNKKKGSLDKRMLLTNISISLPYNYNIIKLVLLVNFNITSNFNTLCFLTDVAIRSLNKLVNHF